MIAREQGFLLTEREAHVVRHVPRRVQRGDAPAPAFDDVAIGERYIGNEIVIDAGIESQAMRCRRRHPAMGIGPGPRRRLEFSRQRRMIGMRMGDEDVAHRFAAQGMQKRCQVVLVIGTGIDDRHLAPAGDESGGAP